MEEKLSEAAVPQEASGLHPVADYFRKEWRNVKTAPFFFLACIVIGGGCAFWFVDHLYAAEIRGKDATIAQLSLRPESIPAQEEELLALRTEVEKLKKDSANYITDGGPVEEWPLPRPEQLAALSAALGEYKEQDVFFAIRDSRSIRLANVLVEAAKKAKWTGLVQMSPSVEPGIYIYCPKNSLAAKRFEALFVSMNLRPRVVEDERNDGLQIELGELRR